MTVRILNGDCREILRSLPAESVHCVVTSPPYWGLRDYGVPGQIGLEDSARGYVSEMTAVFAEVRRVLRSDGTAWLNLGDSYAGGGNYRGINSENTLTSKQRSNRGATGVSQQLGALGKDAGAKSKDLVGIPWLVAFALRADGWYLRQDIIWSKPNPMPESVTDRCTKAHEYLFLLSKSQRYHYDASAIAEPAIHAGRLVEYDGSQKNCAAADDPKMRTRIASDTLVKDTRNRRSVWEVTTQPFSEAHFATFPPALIEPCILAGCPEKACAKCGAPWARDVTVASRPNWQGDGQKHDGTYYRPNPGGGVGNDKRERVVGGLTPTCKCNWEYTTSKGVVLDPFGGAGTTGLVADRLGRDAILIELNPEYADMAERRIRDDAGMFANVD